MAESKQNRILVLFLLLSFALKLIVAGHDEQDCETWCNGSPKEEAVKCTWDACRMCPFCLCDVQVCSSSLEPLEIKCQRPECLSCDRCITFRNSCQGWCERNPQVWDVKCRWADCQTCGPCSPTVAPVQQTASPVETEEPDKNQDSDREPGGKPNILLIFADDIGTGDVPGYWGNTNNGIVDMPNIYEMVNKGVTFMDAHSTPLCAPSRYALLSGNYPHRGRAAPGTWGIGEPSQFVGNQKAIAQVLRDDAGYHTAMMGKWHLGGKIPTSVGQTSRTAILTNKVNDWTLPLVEGPQTFGFDSSLTTDQGLQDKPYSFFRDGYLVTDPLHVRYWDVGTYDMHFGTSEIEAAGEGDLAWDSSAYNMILVNETNRFLDDHLATRSNDPFFAYVALGAAHTPHSPPKSFIDGTTVAGETPTKFLDMLKELDLVVGSLTKSIEDRGLLQDTIIILCSDNGGLPNRLTHSRPYGHRTGGRLRSVKGSMYEGGHRVPLIMRYDGVFPAGEKRYQLLGINDIFATLCDIAGVAVPPGSAVDSVSFADYIKTDDSTGLRQYLGIWRDNGTGPLAKAIRFRHFKLTFDYGTNVTEFYNLRDDIQERYDLSKNPANRDLIRSMMDELSRIRAT